jgi:hypothetical protein
MFEGDDSFEDFGFEEKLELKKSKKQNQEPRLKTAPSSLISGFYLNK